MNLFKSVGRVQLGLIMVLMISSGFSDAIGLEDAAAECVKKEAGSPEYNECLMKLSTSFSPYNVIANFGEKQQGDKERECYRCNPEETENYEGCKTFDPEKKVKCKFNDGNPQVCFKAVNKEDPNNVVRSCVLKRYAENLKQMLPYFEAETVCETDLCNGDVAQPNKKSSNKGPNKSLSNKNKLNSGVGLLAGLLLFGYSLWFVIIGSGAGAGGGRFSFY